MMKTEQTQIQHIMMNNFLTLISTETIKPSSSCEPSKPYKLSFVDQLMPTTYVPLILFYPHNNFFKNPNFSLTLKLSLSQTLATFFPFSGRLKDNLFVHNFNDGISFSETKVTANLSEFLQNPQLDKLNQFLPTQPMTPVSSPAESLPILYVQLNNFQCGGIALSICFSHKISDANSVSNFLQRWSKNNVNIINDLCNEEIVTPNFDESSLRFPPFNVDPSHCISIMDKLFFIPRKRTTRRFVFNCKAISSLEEKATTETESGAKIRPTRIRTLSSFIWKCCTIASTSISLTPRMSFSVQFVNLRKRTEPSFPEYSIGNLLWLAVAAYEIVDSAENDARMSHLKDFVGLTNESVDEVLNVDFLRSLEGNNGCEVASEFLDLFDEIYSTNPEMFVFSSWVNFGINELDFGLGKPAWVSLMGEVGPALRNFTVFNECCDNDGIEAWITLDDELMDILEHDPEFINYAIPNPSIFVDNQKPN